MARSFRLTIGTLIFLATATPICHAKITLGAFGAISDENTVSAAFKNASALTLAFQAANQAPLEDRDARTVVIPAGTTYHLMPISIAKLDRVTFQIDGNLIANADVDAWPLDENGRVAGALMRFQDCRDFVMRGGGLIDGNGFEWWVLTITGKLKRGRPHLVVMHNMVDTLIEGLRVKNSPQFHFALSDMLNLVVRDLDIQVDISAQRTLLDKHGFWIKGLPTFPLNTDGIDPSGENILIQNVTIENFDDAVVVKPTSANSGHGITCSQNILVDGARVKYGVGMSIGSVPPSDTVSCARNITFRNVVFDHPFKAIYIKTNPGDQGTGIVEHVLYENMIINHPLWWAIYIGPQQHIQPQGPVCFFYPIDPRCPTEPRITIRDVTLRNIQVRDGLLSPGVIRCDEANPCTDIRFENVVARGGLSGLPYICENVTGTVTGSSPEPGCLTRK